MKQLTIKLKAAFICLALLGAWSLAQAAPPQKVNFQGRLTDLSDNPLNGTYSLTFSLYSALTGGTQMWTETQSGVSIVNGALDTELGSVTPVPYSAASAAAYLEIQVDGETLSPRQPFNSVLYSYNTYQLGGLTAVDFVNTFSSQTISGVKMFSANPVFNPGAIPQRSVSGLESSLAGVAADTTTLKSEIDNFAGDNMGDHMAKMDINMYGYSVYSASAVMAGSFYGDGSNLTGITASGDNFGNHMATTDINMYGYSVYSASAVMAGSFYGDGSNLTGITAAGDNMGDHTATMPLNMGGYPVGNVSSMTVAGLAVTGGAFTVLNGTSPALALQGASLGIGTAMPGFGATAAYGNILHVYDNTAFQYPGIFIEDNDTAPGARWFVHAHGDGRNSFAIRDDVNAFEPFYIEGADIGIGTDDYTPMARLHVLSSAPVDNIFLASNGPYFSTIPRFVVKGNGNVGVGTESPLYQFVIDGTTGYPGPMVAISTGGVPVITMTGAGEIMAGTVYAGEVNAGRLYGDGSGLSGISGDNLGSHTATTDLNMSSYTIFNVQSMTAGAYYGDGSNLTGVTASGAVLKTGDTMTGSLTIANATMTVTGDGFSVGGSTLVVRNGYVGIGRDPMYFFDVAGQGVFLNQVDIRTMTGPATLQAPSGTLNVNTAAGGDLAILGNGTPRSIFKNTGNVGIGTQTPAYRLVVSSGAGETGTIFAVAVGTANVARINGVGEMYAAKYYGDGSGLTGIVASSSATANAVAYQINGSTVLALPQGIRNLALGVDAGILSTGQDNVFLGYQAGYSNTTGQINVFVGNYAGSNNTTGGDNVFIGRYAGNSNTSGTYNIIIGNTAGYGSTGAAYNTIVGNAAGYSNTTGGDNTFVGYRAASYNTTGINNTVIGSNAAYYSMGSNNVVLGYKGGQFTSGSANSILGTEAGYGVLDNSFSSATLVGYHAGYALTIGGENTLIGVNAGSNLTTGGRNVIIGANAQATAPTISDELNIGGLIWGRLAQGRVGIGFTSTLPTAALDVRVASTDTYVQVWRGSSDTQVATMTASGYLYAAGFVGDGSGLTGIGGADNLGNHTATQTLDMANNQILNVTTMTVADAVVAGYFVGDGSGLSNVPGDNLGNHTATQNLNMSGYSLDSVGGIGVSELNADHLLAASYVAITTGTAEAPLDVMTTNASPSSAMQLWRRSDGVAVATMTAIGTLSAASFQGDGSGLSNVPGDNLGNHAAAMALDMTGYPLNNISTFTLAGSGLRISSDTGSGSGIYISALGEIYTLGTGYGTYQPAARGMGSIDLQNRRMLGTDNVAGGNYSTIAGGESNKVLGAADHAFIGAGDRNSVSAGQNGVVAGGYLNALSGSHGFIGGGYNNTVGGAYGTVGGGQYNAANSQMSTIAGGYTNTIDTFSDKSVIFGGSNNAVSNGFYAAAGGFYARSNAYGAFTWADSQGQPLDNNVADRTVFKNRGGFIVTGSTNTSMTAMADRGVIITGNGLVGIAVSTPAAALDVVSTGTASNIYAQRWRNSSGNTVALMDSNGLLGVQSISVEGGTLWAQNTNVSTLTVTNGVTANTLNVSSIAATGRIYSKSFAPATIQEVNLSGTMSSFAADGSGLVYLNQVSDSNTITSITGCNDGTVAQGQQVLFVAKSYSAGTAIFSNTASGSIAADNILGVNGFWIDGGSGKAGSTTSLLCTTINGFKVWVEVSTMQISS